MSGDNVIRVGSRKSQLALIQTNSVIQQLLKFHSTTRFEIVSMTTTGDNILDSALSKIGEKSLFTKELEIALLDRSVDFVVHSLKDLPTELPDGLVIGAVCKRDEPRDAVVMRLNSAYTSLATLPTNSIIGTSSLRRAAQLKRNFPHLQFADVRGNLNTRLKKLDETNAYSALILAAAGLERMGWQDRITELLEPETCMYAIGQGAMAVECRANDPTLLTFLSVISDEPSVIRCVCERAFLRTLEGGCSVPVAVHTEIVEGRLVVHGGVYSIDGSEAVVSQLSTAIIGETVEHSNEDDRHKQFASIVAEKVSASSLGAAVKLGVDLANQLMSTGAAGILAVAKKQTADEIRHQKAVKMAAATTASE